MTNENLDPIQMFSKCKLHTRVEDSVPKKNVKYLIFNYQLHVEIIFGGIY